MRVLIDLAAITTGWRSTVSLPDSVPITGFPALRDLRRMGDFPLPPAAELQALAAGAPHAALLQAASTAPWEAALASLPADPAAREALGRSLFAALLGDAVWQAMGSQPNPWPLELQLRLPPAEPLQRLPWEMLHDGSRFLVADPARPLSLLRVVAGAQGSLPPLSSPPRVLFVLAGNLNEPAMSAGAGFIALLRRLQNAQGSCLHTRLLLAASLRDLQGALNAFRPQIVHVIAPLDETAGGPAVLGLPHHAFRSRTQWHTPEALVQPFAGIYAGDLRPLVVLHPAAGPAGSERSYAAALVAAGMPGVAILGGTLSDHACRLFVRRLYEALIEGQSLPAACDEGRRAGYPFAAQSAAWAQPALFSGESRLSTVPAADTARARRLSEVGRYYRLANRPPVFCGRFNIFQEALANLFAVKGTCRALMVEVSEADQGVSAPRFGKTRLLEELAFHGLLEGYVPLRPVFAPGEQLPGALLPFALRLLRAAVKARTWLGLPPFSTSEVVKLNRLAAGQAPAAAAAGGFRTDLIRQLILQALSEDDLRALVYDHFREVYNTWSAGQTRTAKIQALIEHCEQFGQFPLLIERIRDYNPEQVTRFEPQLGAPATAAATGLHADVQNQYDLSLSYDDPEVVAAALRLDLADLAVAARLAAGDTPAGVLVLLDDLNRFNAPLVDAILNVLLTPAGFGPPGSEIPVVMAFSRSGAAQNGTLDVLTRFLEQNRPYVTHQRLSGFDDPEAWLVYGQYLLWPSRDAALPPLVVSPQAEPAAVEALFQRLRNEVVRGIPSRLVNNDALDKALLEAWQQQLLEEANDSALLGRP